MADSSNNVKNKRHRNSSSILRCFADLVLVFIFTSTLLMIFVSRIQHRETTKEKLKSLKDDYKERERLERLKKLQKEIFRNPNRPPDSTYNINVTLSEHISLERNVTDTRPRLCRRHYDLSILPTVSVVIPFYNDALSMILRTVHSVLLRTPKQLLKEVS